MNWIDVQTTWNDGWAAAYDQAQSLWASKVEKNLETHRDVVEQYIATLDAWRGSLERCTAFADSLPDKSRERVLSWVRASYDRYAWYGAGFWPYVSQRPRNSVGAVPVAILIGVGAVILVVGIAAVAWAVATSKSADADYRAQEAYEAYLVEWARANEQGVEPPASPPAPDPNRAPDIARTVNAATGLVLAGGAVLALWLAWQAFGRSR